ncbi:MAG: LamG-like jellyroll fold domain-containing protein [bacterium]
MIELISAEGRIVPLQANADDDEDGILNSLEADGFTYSPSQGLQPWDGDPHERYFKTDPLRWSSDGDPYSDYMEVTGVNMPAGVPSPENHPLVAARPVIHIAMTDYDVIPISEITNTDGGEESASFTNETSSIHEVGGEVTVEASLNPFKLASASVTASYSHTWSRKESTTSILGSNWSNARSTNTSATARLRLRVYMQNLGSATALDVQPTFNLVLGEKTIATITPSQIAERLAPQGLPHNRYPETGTLAIEKDDQNNDIIVSLEELKAIQSGAPLDLVVTQVRADVARWNSSTQSFDSREEWSSFEGEIDPVVVTLKVNLGDNDIRQYQVYVGTDFYNLGFTFQDVLSTVLDLEEINGETYIAGRQYPDNWYVSTPAEKLIEEWNRQGQPRSLLNLPMIRNTQLVLMSPGAQPQANIDLAIFDPDFKKIYVSAFPRNFPILRVRAQVTIDGQFREVELKADNTSLYTNSIPFESPAHPDGVVLAENARGDITTAKIIKPVFYKNAADVKHYSTFLPNPGGEFFIFSQRNPEKPIKLYCLFYDPLTGASLDPPREYLTLSEGNGTSNFIEYREDRVYDRVFFNKVRLDPESLILDCSDSTFSRSQSLGEMTIDIKSKPVFFGSIHYDLQSANQINARANINLTGTPFSLGPYTQLVDNADGLNCVMLVDESRQVMNIECAAIATEFRERKGYSGISPGYTPLIYNREFHRNEGFKLPGQSLEFNLTPQGETGYINMGPTDALNVYETVTLEVWIKPEIQDPNREQAGVIFNKNDEYQFLRFPDGTLRWKLNTSFQEGYINTCFNAEAGKWVHLALTYDRNAYFMNIYINGNLFQQVWACDPVGFNPVNQEVFLVAAQAFLPSPTYPFVGSIDELRIWNIARTAEQIRETMYSPLDPSLYTAPGSGLIGYWRFDQLEDLGTGSAGGNDVRDYSINQNHGDVTGDARLSSHTADITDFLLHQ